MSTPTYQPRADSLASMCIGFFTNNPQEHLGLEDISEKFGATRGNIHSILRPALDAGFLLRERNDDGEYIFQAGPAISTAKTAPADNTQKPISPRKSNPPPGRKATAPRGYTSTRHILDFSSLQVDEGVPCMPLQAPGKSKWEPVFDALGKPGQSIALPGYVKAALAAAVAHRNKQKRGTFKVAMTGPSEARIWRIA